MRSRLGPRSICRSSPRRRIAQQAACAQQAIQLPPDTAERVADALQSMSKAMQDISKRSGQDAATSSATIAGGQAADRAEHQGAEPGASGDHRRDLQRAQRALKRAIANMPDPNHPKPPDAPARNVTFVSEEPRLAIDRVKVGLPASAQ